MFHLDYRPTPTSGVAAISLSFKNVAEVEEAVTSLFPTMDWNKDRGVSIEEFLSTHRVLMGRARNQVIPGWDRLAVTKD